MKDEGGSFKRGVESVRRRLVKKLTDLLVQSKKPKWPGKQPPVPPEPAPDVPDKVWKPAELKRTPVSPDIAVTIGKIGTVKLGTGYFFGGTPRFKNRISEGCGE